jgi:adenine-specific DNA-methyltransferase
MNFRENESPAKLRGGYYTPSALALFLTRWIQQIRPQRVLEPSCGDGVFFEALARSGAAGIRSLVGFEIVSAEAQKARQRATALSDVSVTVHPSDFLQWARTQLDVGPAFDAVIGNPPFIRYQYLDATMQNRAEAIFAHLSLEFTRHTNAWVPFVVASLALLRPGGRLAMVVPAELLHVLHACSLRRYLGEQCSRILVLDLDAIWFKETLQGVVLLLAQKREAAQTRAEVSIMPFRQREPLEQTPEDFFRQADFFAASSLNGKWMLGLLTRGERALLERFAHHPKIRPFCDLASVDVGIVTGANKFFLVPDSVIHTYGLEDYAQPMFGRSEHVRGVIYDCKHHQANRAQGLPANFVWLGDCPLSDLPEGARRYVVEGERQGLPGRYKCRIRSPWYNVPSVYVAPVAMLKRAHHFPRLILNTAKACTTDTAYRIVPHRDVKATGLVSSFVNSLTALTAELEGRHYGGGVLELVPSEIERLLLPVGPVARRSLRELHRAFQVVTKPEELLAWQDARVLQPLGISGAETESLLVTWLRLRSRRHRTTTSDSPVEATS